MEENKNDKFWSLKKMLFKEEFLEQTNKEESTEKPAIDKPIEKKIEVMDTSIPLNANADSELMKKIYTALESMNISGIDFMELWNSMQAMGGVNATNLKNSFTALKIASGNTLTKDVLLDTGNAYLSKITEQLSSDILLKEKNYSAKQTELNQNKAKLELNRNEIHSKIKELQDSLSKLERDLSEIDSKYIEVFNDLKNKINNGKVAKQKISEEISSIITLINNNI